MLFIFLVLLNVILFFPSLVAYFFIDDADWLVHARGIATNHALLFTPEGGRTRPLLLLIYHAQYKLFGLNAVSYHSCNIIVHFLNACLVFLLAKKFSEKLPLHEKAKKLFPVFSSILFSVLFSHYQPVIWINFISESLCTFFVLVSLLLFIETLECQSIFQRAVSYPVSLIFFALSLLTKESSYAYPLILPFATLFFKPEQPRAARIALTTPFILITALHFLSTGNFGYISVHQEQNLSSSAPTLGLHFIPIMLDCLTDLLLSLTGIVRIPGFYSLRSPFLPQTLVLLLSFTTSGITVLFLAYMTLNGIMLRNDLRQRKTQLRLLFRYLKNVFYIHEFSFRVFCIASLFLLFLPNSFFFYLFTQTGASLARYRYLYLPSVPFCLLTAFLFASYLRPDKKKRWNTFIFSIFSMICMVNVLNTLVMQNYHIIQGQKVRKYVQTLQSLKPPLKDGDIVVMLDFPQEEIILQSFHMKAYVDLFLKKKVDVAWATSANYIEKTKRKKHVHILTFNKNSGAP